MADISDDYQPLYFHNHLQDDLPAEFCRSTSQPESKHSGADRPQVPEGLCNGSVVSACVRRSLDETAVSDDCPFSPSACSSGVVDDGDDLTPEVQQAYRIFQSFLTEKHKALTAPFWQPIGPGETGETVMSFKRIDDKFVKREYESITEFVADFRLMLENCYRFHGVDHWISKQGQKLEVILEQKLTLLSRTLREKTTLVVTSRGRFGTEDEKAPSGTSTRRRSVPRSLATIKVGGCESIMVQALRQEEQLRAKEEKRQRELEKKEAEETSAKEVEDWEHRLLSLAEPWSIDTMWELPAIGHFLCLAQKALNLPEIVFYELERCLLMPRCSTFLAKIMSSLLCQPSRRATLHRRPALPYRRWEAELRHKVLGWYQDVGRAEDQVSRAEKLGLCHRFFWTLGETSPLETSAFHLLPFNQRVWLLKGLCDNVYETQKDVQDAVLSQPIYECRESILGYDAQENTYIHFPHFCGADLRIYRQSPCAALRFPLPPFSVKKLECEMTSKGACDESHVTQDSLGRQLRIKEENEDNVDLQPWINEDDILRDVDASSEESDSGQKLPERFLFVRKEESPNSGVVEEKPLKVEPRVRLKEQDNNRESPENSDCEPVHTVGKNCYKWIPPSTGTLKEPCQNTGPCPKCSTDSESNPQPNLCFCLKIKEERTGSVSPRQVSRSRSMMGTVCSRKKKRKKKKDKSHGVNSRMEGKRTLHKTAKTNVKSKDRRKRRKLGKNINSKTTKEREKELPQLPVEPAFKLVCSSLDELRDLISKTDDHLNQLESTKKRCGRWSLKKSVKEFHSTLLRLLNELLPWEPKLLKAFQRNRARLKKESDDFKKHPEYEHFIREEHLATESDGGPCKKGSSTAEVNKELEDEDSIKRTLKEDPGMTGGENQLQNESLGRLIHGPEVISAFKESGPLTRSLKRRQSSGLDDDFTPGKRGKMVVDDFVIPEPQAMVPSRDQNDARAYPPTTVSVKTASLDSFQRHCKPIQALLAKSVGNKVTLMSHPQASVMDQTLRLPNRTVSAAVPPTRPTINSQLTPEPAPVPTQTQAPVTSSTLNSPVQVVYNMSEGLNLVKKEGTPVKFSVQPVVDKKTGEMLMQQVIILPSNLLIQKTEERTTQQPCVTSVSVCKTTTALPGVTLSENKIPVQQVAPLKATRVVKAPSPTVAPIVQQVAPSTASPLPKKASEPCSLTTSSPVPTSHSNKSDAKQELKTVCIRDSQSILVTTRGGNTGVVKVQNSDQNGANLLPSSPVFAMPPQFQAFLVSKASTKGTFTVQSAHTTATTKLLPTVSTLDYRGPSFKASGALTSSNDLPASVMSVAGSQTKLTQTSVDNNFLHPATSQSTATGLSTVRPVQGVPQTPAINNAIQSPLKRCQVSNILQEQPTLQNVFLVAPTSVPGSATNISTAPALSAVPESRVLFMSQSAASHSTVTMSKATVTSEPSITAADTSKAVEAIKVRPSLVQASGTGTLTKVQGINISGLTTRMVDDVSVQGKDLAPWTEPATKDPSIHTSSSSGLLLVQKGNPVATNCPAWNIKGPVKVDACTDNKTLMFSTYGTGHMASSALLSPVDEKSMSSTVSISNMLNNKSEPVVGNSTVGSLANKDTNSRRMTTDKPWITTSLAISPSPIKPPVVTSVPMVSHPPSNTTTSCISSTQCQAPQANLPSRLRIPVNLNASTTTQEKVVINTNAPLAPGTQLFINNMRFVVPAQGLASGSHVLLIANPAAHHLGPAAASSVPLVLRGAGTCNPSAAVPIVQGPRMVAPGIQAHHMPIRLPAEIQGMSVPVHQPPSTVRNALAPKDSATAAQVTQLGTVITPGQQSLTNFMRLPTYLSPEGKGHSMASLHCISSCSQETVAVSEQSNSPSTATPALLQTGLVITPPKAQLTSDIHPVRTMFSRASPVVAMPPMSRTASRMQTLPVATVTPIGGTINSCQTAPIATVLPSVNTVIMAPCQAVRGAQPGRIRMPVVITSPSQVQGKTPVQQLVHTPSKLLLSPDGAVLNVVSGSTLQNPPVLANTTTTQVVVPTYSSVTGPVLNKHDSQSLLTVNPEEPNH